jgi:hypothetical protein
VFVPWDEKELVVASWLMAPLAIMSSAADLGSYI